MSKRKRLNKAEIKLKRGYGTGYGENYQSWIKIQDIASKGRSTRFKSNKSNRQQDFLSDMERNYSLILNFSDKVEDIKEQYPLLPIEETKLIANELGIIHHKNHKTGEDIVLTTDFLITIYQDGKRKDVARTIKSIDNLQKKRTLEKFEIEREYFKRNNIDWAIVTENEINKTLAKNIDFIYKYKDITDREGTIEINSEILDDLILEFTRRIIDSTDSIRYISSIFDKEYKLKFGTGITIFKYLLINKIIRVDLRKELNLDEVIKVELYSNPFTEVINKL